MYGKESLPEPIVKISDTLEVIEPKFNQNCAKPFLIISRYRPPSSGVDEASFEYLRNILQEADREEKK